MSEARLLLARWLLDAGAGASARNVLGRLRGAEANRLRVRADHAVLSPGIYALVALDAFGGAAMPLRAALGSTHARDADVREACATALTVCRAAFGSPALPTLCFEFEESVGTLGGAASDASASGGGVTVVGASIGLPALLAFASYYAPAARAPRAAVLATGRVTLDGRMTAVGHMAAKLAVAAAERGVGRVLVPEGEPRCDGVTPVATAADALAMVFGTEPLTPDPRLLGVNVAIALARAETAPERAIGRLEPLADAALAAADQARVWLELGTAYRHAGRSDEAAALHARARALLEAERLAIGSEAAERYELECWATVLDGYDRLDEAIAALTSRLARPFLSLLNELRARGMLAQALGMAGRFAEAARVRAENVALQQRSDALRRSLAGTHCYIALDAARAADAPGFEASARAMCEASSPGDVHQWRYNAAALVRGLVALGRCGDALAWAAGDTSLFGVRAPAALVALAHGRTAPVAAHPEVSVLRALCRAWRRAGAPREALRLAECVAAPPGADAPLGAHGGDEGAGSDLVGWLTRLVAFERALALGELGDAAQAAAVAAGAQALLPRLHAGATRRHAALVLASASPEAWEVELDRVWY